MNRLWKFPYKVFCSVTTTNLSFHRTKSGFTDVIWSKIKRTAGSPLAASPRKMPPIPSIKEYVTELTTKHTIMVFSKTTCSFCTKVKDVFKMMKFSPHILELDKEANGAEVQEALLDLTGQTKVPNVFIHGKHLGGHEATVKAAEDGRLVAMINQQTTDYDYDLVVIGGGSGGLAASKMTANLGKKVAVYDFVQPTPSGTQWGLGGTCVNVGCIPKKLMHQAALIGHTFSDSKRFGWEIPGEVRHSWDTLRNSIQEHIGSLNWGYRVQLRDKKVDYKNAYAEFVDNHTIKAVDRKGTVTKVTADKFILATGERPRYPDIPGAMDYAITSDDLFSLPYCPGKTLVVGASYVSLECAGFMASFGLDVTVMVRSILLRGFDQQMAEKVGEYMEKHGTKFIRPCVPTKIEMLEEGSPGKLKVTGIYSDGTHFEDEFNTVMIATGRDPCTSNIGLEKVGVKTNKAGFVPVDDHEQTNVENVYAIGDIMENKPELTPVAIQAGQLLARRLFGNSTELTEYKKVATTVFTPLEYGCIGYSEEEALDRFGDNNIEVYHTNFRPLEWTVPQRDDVCYAKLICHVPDKERVIGFHVIGPNAGEVTQGYAVAMRCGATKADFDATIGIHPTSSEVLTVLDVTKRSGGDISQSGC